MIKFFDAPEQIKAGLNELSAWLNKTSNLAVKVERIQSGYEVVKNGDDVTIRYGELNTFFRALFMLLRNADISNFSVSNHNAFDQFGVMEDMSRNAVASVSTLKLLIRNLALMGYNTLQLYTEDTLEVGGEPYFGYMRGRFTKSEIKELDGYCKIFGIELVPCIQTLAHINQITRYHEYEKITDYDDILLVGEERTYELLENLIRSCAECFSSKKINIGMDEAHMLGLGKYLEKHGSRPRFEIMSEHLSKVSEILAKYGFSAVMWSDMFFRLVFGRACYDADPDQIPPELLNQIPKDIKLLYWDYYSVDEKRYDGVLKKHLKLSGNVGFAGGAWKWMGFSPDNRYSIKSLSPAIKACKSNKIKYCLITSWGDNGGEASMFSVLPALCYAADLSYDSYDGDGVKVLTGLNFEQFISLDLLNQITDEPDHIRCNHSKFYLYNDLFFGTFDSVVKGGQGEKFRDYANKLQEVADLKTEYSYLFETAAALAQTLSVKTELGISIREAYAGNDKNKLSKCVSDLDVLSGYLIQFADAFYRQWTRENKPFGLEVQQIRLGGLKERITYVKSKLQSYLNGVIDKVEELDEKLLPFGYRDFDEGDGAEIGYNLWRNIVSPSVIG